MERACLVITKAPSSKKKKIDFRLLKWLNVKVSQDEMYVPQSAIARLLPLLEV